jgi:hypothetical protein
MLYTQKSTSLVVKTLKLYKRYVRKYLLPAYDMLEFHTENSS